MEMQTIIAAVFSGLSVLLLYLIWEMSLADQPPPRPAPSARLVSWAVILYLLFWKALFYESRPDLLALMEEGMSASNIKQSVFVAGAATWSAFLLATGRVRIGALIAGPSFWMTSLILVFLASAAWSVWPEYTLFRVLELATFWIVSLHLFPVEGWVRQLARFLLLATLAEWLDGVLEYQRFGEGVFLEAVYRNSGSLLAAALLIVTVHQIITTNNMLKWGWRSAFACLSMVVFGSLTTAAASVIAVAIVLTLWMMRRADPVASGLTVLLMALGLAAFGGIMLTSDAEGIAELFSKEPEQIGTMTGRLPLWTAIWEISKNNPFGSGFGAAERFITAMIGDRYWTGWTAAHSHNGFISAWLGAGFPGLLLSICMILSVLRAATRMAITDRVLVVPLMILMITNNMSVPAFGGQFNPAWMIIMAMICGPYQRRRIKAVHALAHRDQVLENPAQPLGTPHIQK